MKRPIIDLPSEEQFKATQDLSIDLTPELEEKIEKLLKFFNTKEHKKAYPNYDVYMPVPGQHDVSKWMNAVKQLHTLEKNIGRVPAIRQVTSGWKPTETFDFLNWLKFYQSGDYMKYKFAQLWYENGAPGYFLPIKKEDKNEVALPPAPEEPSKRELIERQRNKIIGRLDSAEKLMRSQEGHFLAGKEFENLLDAIYLLKKKIQTVNKISSSTKLYEDLIIRQANILNKQGFDQAACFLYTLAQANNPPPEDTGTTEESTLSPVSPDAPTVSSGAPGGLPSTGPGSPVNQDSPNENSPVDAFLENLETGNITTKEDLDVQDSEDELVVEAQTAPPPAPPAPVSEEPLEVTEQDIKKEVGSPSETFDDKVNQVFSNISISDVVAKLEDLAKIFKIREIPRQLGIIDMMLDSLGIASFFPSLSEATNKALESNNYISTRVEDILSKLRGAMKTTEVDLKGSETQPNPAMTNIKNKLTKDEEKEKARKQMRKDQETAELENNKETPEVDLQEGLETPQPPVPTPPPR